MTFRALVKVPKAALAVALLAVACAPEIGSEAWCERMEGQSRGDWTMNEAADYARHCVLD